MSFLSVWLKINLWVEYCSIFWALFFGAQSGILAPRVSQIQHSIGALFRICRVRFRFWNIHLLFRKECLPFCCSAFQFIPRFYTMFCWFFYILIICGNMNFVKTHDFWKGEWLQSNIWSLSRIVATKHCESIVVVKFSNELGAWRVF